MDVLFIIVWVGFSLVVGAIGQDRNIGFVGGFVISLLLSPVIGLIAVLVSRGKLETQILLKQRDALQNPVVQSSAINELESLAKLKEGGYISEEEYTKLKLRILPQGKPKMHVYDPTPFVDKKPSDTTVGGIVIVVVVVIVIVLVVIKNSLHSP